MGITSFLLSSARAIVPAGSHSTKSMNGFSKFCVLALFASGASAGGPQRRGGKNLRGTFPFNQANGRQAHQHQAHGDHHAHHDHHDHAAHAVESVPARDARQRGRGGDDVALDIGSIAAAGERCIDKVVMVEETEYDDVIECKHVTKLVPLLKPAEECVDIPKEVCSRSRTNPRKVQKPVVKKWCYVPTTESGLA